LGDGLGLLEGGLGFLTASTAGVVAAAVSLREGGREGQERGKCDGLVHFGGDDGCFWWLKVLRG
jgi:hypothetical protein